jgi:hypothetical protein
MAENSRFLERWKIRSMNEVTEILSRWKAVLRLQDWDIGLEIVDTEWRKTGDIKIDMDDRQAILMINSSNANDYVLDELVVHELLHLKLYGLDQMLEQLLYGVYGENREDPRFEFAYGQFMTNLESTVEDLSKGFLQLADPDRKISWGRVRRHVDRELAGSE